MRYNLSEVLEVIKNRRSIYPEQYSERKVSKEQLEKMLEAARWAPTHKLTQPWRFKVFYGEKALKKFADFHAETYKKITPPEDFSEMKYNKLKTRPLMASAVIAVCMERNPKVPEIEEIEAVACAVQNMHLIATAYGLGAYWGTGGLTYHPEMKKFLGLKEDDKCLGLFHVGYPKIEWPKGQRKPMEYYTEWIDE
jgi:nitroreductase